MAKNYRDYSVGELLDMGYEVEVRKFWVGSKEEAEKEVSQFDGVEVYRKELGRSKVVGGVDGGFRATYYIH